MEPKQKYRAYPKVPSFNRSWPDKRMISAPTWCSVDLRDGNQSLINPMSLEEKQLLFDTLVKMGFKEIEVGFPSAADVEFNFLRSLIDNNHIPEDVSVQVLCQCREHLIQRTFDSIQGQKMSFSFIQLHLYSTT